MAYNARNIIVGAAALFFSELDSTEWTGGVPPALPAPVAGTPYATTMAATAADWRHAGYTSEGLELAYEPDYTDIEVDQLLDSAKIFKTSMRATINTTLVEGQLENLLVAWGQPGRTFEEGFTAAELTADPTLANKFGTGTMAAGDTGIGIAAGGLGDEPTERVMVAVGPAPRNAANEKRERVYYARRCLSVDSVSVAVRRDEATMFPVSFRLLPDPAFPDAEYGYIRDRVIGTAA